MQQYKGVQEAQRLIPFNHLVKVPGQKVLLWQACLTGLS